MVIAGDRIIGDVLRESDKLLFIGSFQDQSVQWELTVDLIVGLPIKDEQKLNLIRMLKPPSIFRRLCNLFTRFNNKQ